MHITTYTPIGLTLIRGISIFYDTDELVRLKLAEFASSEMLFLNYILVTGYLFTIFS